MTLSNFDKSLTRSHEMSAAIAREGNLITRENLGHILEQLLELF